MKKTAIAFAVAAAVGVPALAVADTTLYGRFNVSLDFVDDGNETATQLASNSSRLGVRGSEDLGNGLRAVYQLEASLSSGNGTFSNANLTGRNTYLGLAGGFGEVRVGKHDTPYKLSTLRLNYFADTIGDYNHIMSDGGQFYSRDDNMLLYISPKLGDLQFMASYVTDRSDDRVRFVPPGANGANDRDAYSLAATFSTGPVYVAAAFEQRNDANSFDESQAWKIAGTYDIADLSLAAQYENVDYDGDDIDLWHLGARYKIGQAYVMGSYSDAGQWGNFRRTGADMWALGAGYDFSRRTGVYAVYAQVDNEDNEGWYGFQRGGKGKPVSPSALGEEVSGFSVGMWHNF